MLTPSCLLTCILLLLSPQLASSLDCYAPPAVGPHRTPLPIVAHCQELVGALHYAARLPENLAPKEWGRNLPCTDRSEYLPKRYFLPGRGPSSCGFTIDASPQHPDARETFRLADVAVAAGRVVRVCLMGRGQVGRDVLGRGGRVVGKIERTDAPGPGVVAKGKVEEGTGEEVRSLMVPGVGELAWTGCGARNRSVDEA